MKNIILSHNDQDGYGVNVIANVITKINPSIIFHIENCSYKSINLHGYRALSGIEQFSELNVKNCDKLIITDITMSDKMMSWANNFKNVICLDHHEPKAYLSELYSWCKVEQVDSEGEQTSGTLMFFKYAVAQGWLEGLTDEQYLRLLEFCRRVRDYDIWLWKANNDLIPKWQNDIFGFMDREEFIEKATECVLNDEDFVDKYKSIVDVLSKIYSNYKRSKIEEIKTSDELNGKLGFKLGILFADQYISELGNDLCNETEYDAILMVNADKGLCSLRSLEFDVSKVAQMYGGGGHLLASGFTLDNEIIFNNLLDMLKVSDSNDSK